MGDHDNCHGHDCYGVGYERIVRLVIDVFGCCVLVPLTHASDQDLSFRLTSDTGWSKHFFTQ